MGCAQDLFMQVTISQAWLVAQGMNRDDGNDCKLLKCLDVTDAIITFVGSVTEKGRTRDDGRLAYGIEEEYSRLCVLLYGSRIHEAMPYWS